LIWLFLLFSGCSWFPFGMTQQTEPQQTLDDWREQEGKYKGWICITPIFPSTDDKCTCRVLSCEYAFVHCKGQRVLVNYKTGIITFYVPQPELNFKDWEKCWKKCQDSVLGKRR
jgi:hypothetical protein